MPRKGVALAAPKLGGVNGFTAGTIGLRSLERCWTYVSAPLLRDVTGKATGTTLRRDRRSRVLHVARRPNILDYLTLRDNRAILAADYTRLVGLLLLL